jgi:flagellar biosynthesis/type III secretory pathway M-ring protein FliF/YscJ
MAEAGMGGDMIGYLRAYGSRAGLAVLAVMSMVMMLMMVRKVGEGPILPGEEPPARRRKKQQDVESLPLEGQPVGEASVTEQALEGLEVDPSVLKVQHMIEQITEMVGDDPESSVSILERWIQQDQA